MEKNQLTQIIDILNNWERSSSYRFSVDYNCIYEPESNKDTSTYTMKFSPQLVLDSPFYEIGLIDLETFYTIPNVDKKNNRINYYSNKAASFVDIYFEKGGYDIKELNSRLESALKANGDDGAIKILAVGSIGKCEMTLTNTQVDFTKENSINKLLGFNNEIYGEKTATITKISENNINITDINTLFVRCNIVEQSYKNGNKDIIIFSFYPKVPPGFKIVEQPDHITFLPINRNYIDKIEFSIVDNNGVPANFNGEKITMNFYLQKIPLK